MKASHAAVCTVLAMIAFAGNSVLCRLALRDDAIDPAAFTLIRLVAGALVLLLMLSLRRSGKPRRRHGSWLSALMLFLYAAAFSYAYISLNAGTGALILFGLVQITMIVSGLWSGDRPGTSEWLGWCVAVAGLVWLVLPGLEAPPLRGAVLMAMAGIAWGIYSIRGRREADALAATATNFLLSITMAALLAIAAVNGLHISMGGVTLAIVSGGLTSGIGYVLWYAALEYLSAMQAALVQLSVPAIATAGGVLLLGEPLSMRLLVSSTLVLGGVTLALARRLQVA